MKDSISFTVEYEPPQLDGEIYTEWGKCAGCGNDAVCLHVYYPLSGMFHKGSHGICKKCSVELFKAGEKYYRDKYGPPVKVVGIISTTSLDGKEQLQPWLQIGAAHEDKAQHDS
jgi:hypothetical protein